jgi:taurine dioxygenase
MQVQKLPGPFGAHVTGLDLARDMTDETMRRLIATLYGNQILLISSQTLSNAQYVKFGSFWGKPLRFFLEQHTNNDFPEIIKIANSAATPARYRDGAMHWHTDSSYEAIPSAVTMLYGIEVPQTGGETWLCNTAMAYDALPESLRRKIDGQTGLHCLGGAPELPGEKIPFIPEDTARLGIVKHPLVMRHPATGCAALYVSGTAFGIEGWNRAEGRALIAQLRAHCTQPEFTTTVKVTTGDILLWDNFQTMHSATPLEYTDEDGKRRLLHRISTKGLPDLFQFTQPAGHLPQDVSASPD